MSWLYKQELVGARLQVSSESVYQYDGEYMRNTTVSANGNATYQTIVLTGWYLSRSSGNFCQTTGGEYYEFNSAEVEKNYLGETSIYATPSQAQSYVNGIIECNKTILENNLLCARYASKFTGSQRADIWNLQNRLELRNNALLRDGLCKNQVQSYPQGYNKLNAYLVAFMDDPKISGVGAVTLTIVAAAVVVASLGTAAYFAYRYYYEEALKDVKFSNELTAVLKSKLTDEEYAALEKETAGMITKATIAAKAGTTFGWLKYIAFGGLVAFGVYKFLNREKKQQKNK